MKKYIYSAILIFATSGGAYAITPYFSAGMTTGLQNSGRHASTAYSNLWTMTGGVRYALSDNVSMRNEIEYATSDYTFKSGIYEYDTKTQIYMGNIIAEFRPYGFNSGIYAGVSLGTTNYETTLKTPYTAPAVSHSTFTYGAMAGVNVNLVSGLYIDLGLRYLTNNDAKSDGNIITTTSIHYGF